MRRTHERTQTDSSRRSDGSIDAEDTFAEAQAFFGALWRDYVAMTPRVAKIRALFERDNPRVANDHVAFRTFARDPIGLERLERHFLDLGYARFEAYAFDQKKLDAWGYVPPSAALPRVFLSELRVDALSRSARAIIDRLCAKIDPSRVSERSVFYAGTLWPMPTWDDYQTLLAESEYAAWVAALGMRANHFTVSVNSLETPTSLEGVVERVEAAGFALNEAGGKLKGSADEYLEQASTLADRIRVRFGDGSEHEIPSCYYEFALRHPGPDGVLYPGFVAASADRIFESTNARGSDSGSGGHRPS